MNETQHMLQLLNNGFPNIAAMSPLAAREAVDSRVRVAENIDDAQATDHEIQTSSGRLNVRLYQPSSPRAHAPVTVYAHGGGFLHGSIASHDGFCRTWAKNTGSTVVSVEYRLAPEHGAPAASEDLVATVNWLQETEQATAIVIAGDSSGANAAAVAALMIRNKENSPLVGQVLIYPFLDPEMNTQSHKALAEGYFVTAEVLSMYWSTYLGASTPNNPAPWQVDPSLAPDHTGLPPTITITAGLDPLSDEGRTYHRLISAAGTRALHRHYPDQFHGFLTIPNYSPAISAQSILWSDFKHFFLPKTEQTS